MKGKTKCRKKEGKIESEQSAVFDSSTTKKGTNDEKKILIISIFKYIIVISVFLYFAIGLNEIYEGFIWICLFHIANAIEEIRDEK